MRAKECYYAINPDDELEKEMADLRMKAAGENKERQAEVRLRSLKANSEALAIILQWIDQAHRPKIRRCTKANEAWELLRPMRIAMTADILTGKFHDLKIEDFSKATDAMNELQSILNEIYATSEDAEKEFSQPAAVRMAVSKLPLDPYRQFKYDCFKHFGLIFKWPGNSYISADQKNFLICIFFLPVRILRGTCEIANSKVLIPTPICKYGCKM